MPAGCTTSSGRTRSKTASTASALVISASVRVRGTTSCRVEKAATSPCPKSPAAPVMATLMILWLCAFPLLEFRDVLPQLRRHAMGDLVGAHVARENLCVWTGRRIWLILLLLAIQNIRLPNRLVRHPVDDRKRDSRQILPLFPGQGRPPALTLGHGNPVAVLPFCFLFGLVRFQDQVHPLRVPRDLVFPPRA